MRWPEVVKSSWKTSHSLFWTLRLFPLSEDISVSTRATRVRGEAPFSPGCPACSTHSVFLHWTESHCTDSFKWPQSYRLSLSTGQGNRLPEKHSNRSKSSCKPKHNSSEGICHVRPFNQTRIPSLAVSSMNENRKNSDRKTWKIQYVGREQISGVISFSRENVGGKMVRDGRNKERPEKIWEQQKVTKEKGNFIIISIRETKLYCLLAFFQTYLKDVNTRAKNNEILSMSWISCQLSHSSYAAVIWCFGFSGGRPGCAQNGHCYTEGDGIKATEVRQTRRWAP